MTVEANPTEFGENIAVRVTAPSPLVFSGKGLLGMEVVS
jgi:hypothetical protein